MYIILNHSTGPWVSVNFHCLGIWSVFVIECWQTSSFSVFGNWKFQMFFAFVDLLVMDQLFGIWYLTGYLIFEIFCICRWVVFGILTVLENGIPPTTPPTNPLSRFYPLLPRMGSTQTRMKVFGQQSRKSPQNPKIPKSKKSQKSWIFQKSQKWRA